MNRFVLSLVGTAALVGAGRAQVAADPVSFRKPAAVVTVPNCPPAAGQPGGPGGPGSSGAPTPPPLTIDPNAVGNAGQTENAPFAQREAGGYASDSFNPNMFGDFSGVGFKQGFPRGLSSQTQSALSSALSRSSSRGAEPPLLPRYQGIKLTENDSPRPQDRVSVAYNFYDNLAGSTIDLHRETLFVEKTFLDGAASVELRLPFQQWVFAGGAYQRVGDLTAIGKYAFYDDKSTGDLVSGGLGLTFPTGATLETSAPHSVLIQPYAAFIKNSGNWFAQGFSSVVVPTDSDDLLVWFNSVGVGYWAYRGNGNGFLNGVIPITEVHVNTPLNHRDATDASFINDQVSITSGVHVLLNRSVIGTAINVPVSGPRQYNIEAVLTWNVRY